MLGVYLVAAELSRRGFTVSPTLRNAAGADLLATDQDCQNAWSIQVKTNSTKQAGWNLNKNVTQLSAPSYIYVFVDVDVSGKRPPEFLVVASQRVKAKARPTTGGYWFARSDRVSSDEGWGEFGNPNPVLPPGGDADDLRSD